MVILCLQTHTNIEISKIIIFLESLESVLYLFGAKCLNGRHYAYTNKLDPGKPPSKLASGLDPTC